MNWTDLIKQEIEDIYPVAKHLITLTEGLPLDWKPAQENNWMTTGQLLMHIANACGAPMRGFVTGDWGMPECSDSGEMRPEDMLPPAEKLPTVANVKEALKLLAEDKILALSMIDQAGEQRLANDPSPAPWDPRPTPLGMRLLSMVNHLAAHRDQLFFYLKLQGKPVNTMDLWMGDGGQ